MATTAILTPRRLTIAGAALDLTASQERLLRALAAEPDRLHTKAALRQVLLRGDRHASLRTVDSTIAVLNARLRPHLGGRPAITNAWGVGFRLAEDLEIA